MTEGLYGSRTGQNVLRVGLAELVGTYLLVLAGTAVAVAAVLERSIAGGGVDSLAVALAFGLGLVALVNALGHVSGCHLNPAVTLALAATGRFPWRYVPAYVVAQLAGAVLAALTVWVLHGDAARDQAVLGASLPADGVGSGVVLIAEAVVTFFLVLVIVSVATDPRVPKASAGLAVGTALAVCVLVAGPLSGGAVNPARALGPMIVAGRFDALWAYVVGPLIGGGLAALLYSRFLAEGRQPADAEAEAEAADDAVDASR
ncbi:MIP family channel protein [Geodermatophilus sabuli]|uniref:MIP family channel protein n=1 Tax=Geodermatophilus sabuli TaxID=1564158 RepID=A0A7K3VY83_9ACTN|nr:MIP family channel protein [Geodermatophilus sabuli]NEK57601.1 MIP family channel protein [Geodermatophilus sabuli]